MRKARAAYKTISVSFATISLMVFIAGCSHSHEGGTPEFVEEDRLWKPSPGLEGRIALASSNFDLAITRLTEAIRLDPNYANAYGNRALAYRQKGQLDKAIADWTEAIRLDPKNADAYNSRGAVYGQQSDLNKAIADLTEAIRINPKLALAYYNRGIAYSDKSEYDKAIDDYTESIRLDPKNSILYNNRGNASAIKGDYDKAIADYTESIRLDPNQAYPYSIRAWLWATCAEARFRDGRKAFESATHACELTGWKDCNYLDTLAASYAEAGEFAAAVIWQTKAIELAPPTQKPEFRSRLELYRSGRPYREEPRAG